MKIRGFLSYSHEDGSELTTGLVSYLTNLIQSFEPVYDADINEGEKLDKIPERLILCDILIVIITPGVLSSKAIAEEIKIAKEKNMKIIPCKDKYLQKNWSELPWELESYKGFEFENPGELKRKCQAALVKNIVELSKELRDAIPKKTETEKSTVTLHEIQELVSTNEKLSWEKYTVKSKKKEHSVVGTVKNGKIKKIRLDRKSLSLLIDVKLSNDGFLKIITPRELIDSKEDGQDNMFIILVDGEEVSRYEELDTSFKQRTLQVKLDKHAKHIEIIGTEVEGISFSGEVKDKNIVNILQDSAISRKEPYLNPQILEINAGEKVRWNNCDSATHTIIGGNPPYGPDRVFDSGFLISGGSFEATFTKVGEYSYFDIIHPWIQGSIIVKKIISKRTQTIKRTG